MGRDDIGFVSFVLGAGVAFGFRATSFGTRRTCIFGFLSRKGLGVVDRWDGDLDFFRIFYRCIGSLSRQIL